MSNSRAIHEKTIQGSLARMVDAWNRGDAVAYGREFTDDASYIIYVGLVYRGRAAIERAHNPVFEKYQKGSTMNMKITEVRQVTDDVAIVMTEGGVGRGRTVPLDKVQTYTMVRVAGEWKCAAFQNTKKNRLFLRMDRLFNPTSAGAAA